MTAPALSRNVRGNENTEADNIVGNNLKEDNAIENQLHFGHDNMLFESNRDNEDNNDCTSISSKESIDSRKARRGSLVKEIIEKSNAVCISLDLEHGGDKCGVTQLSAILFRLGGVEDSALSKDVTIREVLTSMSGHHSMQNGTLVRRKVYGVIGNECIGVPTLRTYKIPCQSMFSKLVGNLHIS